MFCCKKELSLVEAYNKNKSQENYYVLAGKTDDPRPRSWRALTRVGTDSLVRGTPVLRSVLASSAGLQRKRGGLVHTAGVLVRMRVFPQILGNPLTSVKYL